MPDVAAKHPRLLADYSCDTQARDSVQPHDTTTPGSCRTRLTLRSIWTMLARPDQMPLARVRGADRGAIATDRATPKLTPHAATHPHRRHRQDRAPAAARRLAGQPQGSARRWPHRQRGTDPAGDGPAWPDHSGARDRVPTSRPTRWTPTRQMLEEISRSRAVQGFSWTETAMFVFSLKKPLFHELRTCLRR